ncbi:MAG: cytochrome c oxidase assembly protein [Ktedonobacterales bacterium]|nr:cytochrome c oxidase assembly protein [Ktedonobacterales bacterium]
MLTRWTFDPAVLAFLALTLGGYLYVIGPLRTRYSLGEPPSRGRQACFVAGWAVLAVSVISPLDAIGRYYLFSAHTAQLLLLTTLAAPLLLFGIPEWVIWRLLPLRALRNATRGLLFPVFAALTFNVVLLFWHIGSFYEAALKNTGLHDLQNLSFLLAGLLTWWPLLTPLDRHTRMATPLQMLYLAAESLPLDIFGVAAIFSPAVFYPTYVHAPRVWGLSPMLDQQIAGALLAVPGNILDIVLMSVIFFAWIGHVEQAQRTRERAETEREMAEMEARVAAQESGATAPRE